MAAIEPSLSITSIPSRVSRRHSKLDLHHTPLLRRIHVWKPPCRSLVPLSLLPLHQPCEPLFLAGVRRIHPGR